MVYLQSFSFFSPSHLNKSGAACLTLVWLLSRVDAGVGFEVGRPVELSPADVAVVGLRTWKLRPAGCAMSETSRTHEVTLNKTGCGLLILPV